MPMEWRVVAVLSIPIGLILGACFAMFLYGRRWGGS
jgi:ABC-type transport system involved in cytochrome c biogenesis permease subunit